MNYDYNLACGFIAIAPPPLSFHTIIVSADKNATNLPASKLENTVLEATYPVYITVKTKGDYTYGGTYYFHIDSPFT